MRVSVLLSPDAAFAAVATMVGLMWSINGDYESPDPLHISLTVAGIAILAAILRGVRRASFGALGYVVAIGIAARVTEQPYEGSDVLSATYEALQVLARGGNPYAHYYLHTIPPGSPVGYFPGEFAFYGLWTAAFHHIRWADPVAAILIVAILASFAAFIGPGVAAAVGSVFATAPLLLYRERDGSNDTAVAFLLILGIALLAFSMHRRGQPSSKGEHFLFAAGAFFVGWALAFKLIVAFIFTFVAAYFWRVRPLFVRFMTIALGVFVAFLLPLAIMSPSGILHGLVPNLVQPAMVRYGLNVWNFFAAWWPRQVDSLPMTAISAFVFVVALRVLLRRTPPTLGQAVIRGCGWLATYLLLLKWSTSAYWNFLATVAFAGLALSLTPISQPSVPDDR